MTDYRHMATLGAKVLLDDWRNDFTGAGFWNTAVAVETMIEYMAAFETVEDEVLSSFSRFTNGSYTDDQGWWGLAFLAGHNLLPEHPSRGSWLENAKLVWLRMQNAWDSTCGGGCWWSTERNYKNSITNELFLKLSSGLYISTGIEEYKTQALASYDWFTKSGLLTKPGLIIDGLNKKDQPNTCGTDLNIQTYTYNQGVILGGLVHLHEITQSTEFLSLAEFIVDATITNLVEVSNSSGAILREVACEDPTGRNTCTCNQTQFKGIFMRNLAQLDRALNQNKYQDFIENNAKGVWRSRAPNSNQFGQVWYDSYRIAGKCTEREKGTVYQQVSGLSALLAALPYSTVD